MDIELILQQIYTDAPEIIQKKVSEIFLSSRKIDLVAKKNNLEQTQSKILKAQITSTILGLTPISRFRTGLVEELNITYDQALKISADVNSQIFGPEVVELLKKLETESKEIEGVEPQNESVETKKVEQDTTIQIRTEQLLPDHDSMLHADGEHLHSQTVMPTVSGTKPAMQIFGSIVDRKLSGSAEASISRSNANSSPKPHVKPTETNGRLDQTTITDTRNQKYKNGDPYREPI